MKKSAIIDHAGKWMKILPAFVFLVSLFSIQSAGAEIYKVPDFAFPQTVVSTSDSLLNVAVKQKDDLLALRGMMNLVVAENMLKNSENVSPAINLVDSVAKKLSSPYSELAYLLEAEILNQAYQSNRVVYDDRNLPIEETFPSATDEWSGEMFKEKISQLIDKANAIDEKNKRIEIETISLLITDCKEAEKIGLTVSDFIAFKSVSILKNFIRETALPVIPFYPAEIAMSTEANAEATAKKLLNQVMNESTSGESVIVALAMIECATLLPDNEKETYLRNSYDKLKNSEGAGVLLYRIWESYYNGNTLEDSSEIYKEINKWLKNYPEGYGRNNLVYAENILSRQRIEVEFPRISLPGQEIKGTWEMSNLSEGYLLVYRLNANQATVYDELILKQFQGGNPLYRIEIKGEQKETPFNNKKEITLPPLTSGLYVVIPSMTKTLPKGWNKATSSASYSTIRVTEISILTTYDSNDKDSGRVYVVKGSDQQPVAGAEVTYYSGVSKKPKGRLITNKEGWVKIPTGYYRVEAAYGRNKAIKDAGFSFYQETTPSRRYATILTDLSIYRPGDTVGFALVGWLQEKNENTLIKNTQVKVVLRDANYISIGSVDLELNEEGRAIGRMVIPQGRLLGNYQLVASYPDYPRAEGGSATIRVEEYKLPSFMVSLEQTDNNEPGVVSFRGLAQTYSGMPVTNGQVQIEVEYQPWLWRVGGSNARYIQSEMTDAEGIFNLSLPTAALKGTIFEKGRYSIKASVTSEAGDTETSQPIYFQLGKAFQVRPAINDKVEITGDSVRFNVPVYDMGGLPVKEKVEYRVTNIYSPKYAFTGFFVSPDFRLPSVDLESGKYKLEFKVSGEENYTSTEVILWRSDDKKAPFPTSLWVPPLEYVYSEGEKSVDVTFGSYWQDWILYTVSDGEKVLESRWISPSDSLHTERVEITAGNTDLYISLSGLHDFKAETGQITVIPKKSLEKMTVETQSFRENLTAGDSEEWSFKFKVNDKAAPLVNAFAVMSDKALNAINDFKWNLNFWKITNYNRYRMNPIFFGNLVSYKTFTPLPSNRFSNFESAIPSWETYGYPLVAYPNMRIYGGVLRKMAATRNMMTVKDDAAAVVEEAQMEMADAEAPVAGGSVENVEEEPLRPVEMPLAFFRGDLKADEDGVLNIKFVVPNFNTTWQLQVAGYDASLLSAVTIVDAVASKPVMVKTNLPQFLRTRDKASVSATLYNNSEEEIGLGGKLEVMDLASGEILATSEFSPQQVSPSGNRVVSILFEVPDDVSAIVVRSYANGNNHTDGEQGVVPVLPSATPVVESTTFYAASDSELIELKVPKINKKANVTLKYCDNPLWEVVMSLPSSKEPANSSSLALARWLYGTMTANDIIGNNNEISEGIRNILISEDSTLTLSHLQRDENFKIVGLDATPWINQASSETERIRGLEKYLDVANVNNAIESRINTLQKLQRADGGWSWFDGMQSSEYITWQVIEIMGYLNDAGLLTPQLSQMAERAVRFYDNRIVERYRKSGKVDWMTMLNYLYNRNMLNFGMKGTMFKLQEATLDSISDRWRHFNIEQKVKAASIMMDSDRYKKESQTIVESLKQFLDKRNTLEEDALMLTLFEKVKSEPEAVDKVRQTMLLKKETENWGDNYNSSGIIYSLLKSIPSDLNINRTPPQIYIDEMLVDLPEHQKLTGNYTINLDASKVSGKKIRIMRRTGLPAWGGVISQFIAPIKDVKSVKVADLSIEKRIFQEDIKGNLKEVTSFRKGDKVHMVLNVNVKKDMDYVVIADSRSACLQTEDKLSGFTFIEGFGAYKEIRKDKTSFFIENLKAGSYVISYDCHADRDGTYSLGMAEVQCLYSPAQVAHSAGKSIKVDP